MSWHVHTYDGRRDGPVSEEQLQHWVAEGRLTPDCQVFQDGWTEWRFASDYFPSLRAAGTNAAADVWANSGATHSSPGHSSPGAFQAPQSGSYQAGPYQSPQTGPFSPGTPAPRYQAPHRGEAVLVLGLLGLLVCGLLSIPAWVMGAADLKEMRAGRMDNSGYGVTQGGMILGIIGCVLLMVGVLALMLIVLAAGA